MARKAKASKRDTRGDNALALIDAVKTIGPATAQQLYAFGDLARRYKSVNSLMSALYRLQSHEQIEQTDRAPIRWAFRPPPVLRLWDPCELAQQSKRGFYW